MKKLNKRLRFAFTGVFVLALIAAGVVTVAAKSDLVDDGTICNNVYIGTVDVSGMEEEPAAKAVNKYVKQLGKRKISVTVGEEDKVETTYADLGFQVDVDALVKRALEVGKSGNLIKRYKEIKDVEKEKLVIDAMTSLDKDKVKDFVEKECTAFDKKAKDSKLRFRDGKLSATKSQKGSKVDVDETVTKLMENLSDNNVEEDVTIAAVVVEDEPKYTKDMLSQCNSLLGTYTTTYGTSTELRATNIAVAAGNINGTTLYPDETFSTSKTMKDRTVANGYMEAAEYNQGKVVPGIGGGVCQVSTTLYNAVLNAELEVVERSPHSMVVAYVDLSRDAAIAGDYMDFKFKNNLDTPIYIQAIAENRTLTFNIYGHETRPEGRTFEFQSETVETLQPGADVVTYDKNQPESFEEVTQEAHIGYKAKLWKIIYQDGKQVDKVQVNSSQYNAAPKYVTKGKKKEDKKDDKKNDKKDKKDDKKDNKKDTEKQTATPKPTSAPQGGDGSDTGNAGETTE